MGLRKINTIGIQQAGKVMHISATTNNLKKLLKFITKKTESMAIQTNRHFFILMSQLGLTNAFLSPK